MTCFRYYYIAWFSKHSTSQHNFTDSQKQTLQISADISLVLERMKVKFKIHRLQWTNPLSKVFVFCGVGLTPPLGPFFRSPRFRFLRSLCSSTLGPYKSQHCRHIGLLYIPRMIHEGDCGVIGGANDDCRGNRSTRRKPAPASVCPTTNPTWPGPVSNPGSQRWVASD
jgi:hypothetical protein